MNNKSLILIGLILTLILVALFFYIGNRFTPEAGKPIRVGVLFSLSGELSSIETSMSQATMLAIETINQQGGLLGRKIEPVIVDAKSDFDYYANAARTLIRDEKVSVVFGGYTSASRKAIIPVFEQNNHLLIYSAHYEGLEKSPNVLYVGAAPNQQAIPAVNWSIDQFGDKIFLVGSDYVYPRTTNEIIKNQVESLGGLIVDIKHHILGDRDFTATLQAIKETNPSFILSTVIGSSNTYFYRQLKQAGIKTPVMTLTVGEQHPNPDFEGLYAAWNYVQSLKTPENAAFVSSLKEKYGEDVIVTDVMESAYNGVRLWANAVARSNAIAPDYVLQALKNTSIAAPGGIIFVDAMTQHVWKTPRIGRMNAKGQFDLVWEADAPVRPSPYPIFKSHEEWDAYQQDLFVGWGGKWAK